MRTGGGARIREERGGSVLRGEAGGKFRRRGWVRRRRRRGRRRGRRGRRRGGRRRDDGHRRLHAPILGSGRTPDGRIFEGGDIERGRIGHRREGARWRRRAGGRRRRIGGGAPRRRRRRSSTRRTSRRSSSGDPERGGRRSTRPPTGSYSRTCRRRCGWNARTRDRCSRIGKSHGSACGSRWTPT